MLGWFAEIPQLCQSECPIIQLMVSCKQVVLAEAGCQGAFTALSE